ncbi:MAG: hypothetical protein M3R60_11630, partial [Pseudomonadota bacterium]|nr:hypothetical protein [Pseudomonadota bacterium]
MKARPSLAFVFCGPARLLPARYFARVYYSACAARTIAGGRFKQQENHGQCLVSFVFRRAPLRYVA